MCQMEKGADRIRPLSGFRRALGEVKSRGGNAPRVFLRNQLHAKLLCGAACGNPPPEGREKAREARTEQHGKKPRRGMRNPHLFALLLGPRQDTGQRMQPAAVGAPQSRYVNGQPVKAAHQQQGAAAENPRLVALHQPACASHGRPAAAGANFQDQIHPFSFLLELSRSTPIFHSPAPSVRWLRCSRVNGG